MADSPLRLVQPGETPRSARPPAPRIVVVDLDDLRELVRSEVTAALAFVTESHAAEVAELRRGIALSKRLLTAEEVGTLLLGGVAAETVMSYARDRGLPCHRPGGRTPLFLVDEVADWAQRSAA